VSETRYAQNGDIHIAYWTIGDGPLDLVWVLGAMTNLEVMWESAEYRRFCERLASFTRLILFDKRGMGLSDRVRIGTLGERMDDVRALGEAHAALVEQDQSRERGQLLAEAPVARMLPEDTEVRDGARDPDQVQRSVSEHLVGDLDTAAVRVLHRWPAHPVTSSNSSSSPSSSSQ